MSYRLPKAYFLLLSAFATACTSSPSEPAVNDLVFHPQVVADANTGESVTFAVTVENPTGHEVTLPLSLGEFSFDPLVKSPDGELIWRRWSGVVTTVPTDYIIVPPNDSVSLSVEWDLRDTNGQPVLPGQYQVTYRIVSEPLGRRVGEHEFVLTVHPT